MELISKHQIYYSNKDLLPLSDVASSLLALEKLIKQSPYTIEKFFPGLKIYDVEIYLNELQSGSSTSHRCLPEGGSWSSPLSVHHELSCSMSPARK